MLAKRIPIAFVRAQSLSETPELDYAMDHPGHNRLAECFNCKSAAIKRLNELREFLYPRPHTVNITVHSKFCAYTKASLLSAC